MTDIATEPRLRRPRSLLAYILILPAGVVLLAWGRLYAQAGLCALLLVQAFLSLVITDKLSAKRFEQDVRSATLGDLRAKREAHRLDVQRVSRELAHLPGPVGGAGYLYALQFASGVVKVGQTTDPRARLRKHQRDSEAFGVAIVGFWLSPAHENYQRNEAALIGACMKVSGRYKNEYFHSIDLATVVALASALSMNGAVRPA